VALGGFVQNGSITEANFLDILRMLLIIEEGPIRVQQRVSGHIVSRTGVPLQTGVYDIYCDCMCYIPPIYSLVHLLILSASIQVSNEPWIPRLISHEISGRESSFRDGIRNRDRKCVISGTSIPEIHIQANNWTTFEAAHIFPPEHERLWIQYNYGRQITDMDDAMESSKINSPQNGFLLMSAVQTMFNAYLISINPDDGYKVVVFDTDIYGYDSRILDPVCRNPADPHCVSDESLRWHFRQSVLANVRGAGEPIFDHDLPSGTDMMNKILASSYTQERFELELPSRF